MRLSSALSRLSFVRRARGARRANRARRGAAAAEFALTAPILVLLLLGTVEYGNYFAQLGMMNGIVRDACRFGSNQGTDGDAETLAQEATRTMLNDIGIDCDVVSCTISSNVLTTTDPSTLELIVDVPYTQLTGVLPLTGPVSFLGPGQLRMRAAYPIVGP